MQDFEKKIDAILSSRYSDVVTENVSEIVRELEKIECDNNDFTVKIDIEAIRKKIELSLILMDESWDSLFSLHQRLINQESNEINNL